MRRASLRVLPVAALTVAASMFAHGQSAKPDEASMHWLQLGSEAMHRGNAAEAAEDFKHVVEGQPQLADGYFGMGLALLREGKLNDAESALEQAVKLNPDMRGAHMFLGIAQYQMNRPEEAAASLEAELSAQPDSVETLNWLGLVYLSAGHADKAAAAFDRAVALTPNDASLQYYRGKAHALVAKDAYQQLYKIDPDSWLVHRALGESLAESGQPDKAIGEFEEAVKKQPNNSDLYEELGESYQKVSRFDEAIKAYQQQVRLNPHSAIALYNLGKIQVERGDAAAGVALLRQAIDAHVDAAPAYFYLGTGLAALNKNEEAVTWLEKAMLSHPSQFIHESGEYELVRSYQKLGRKEDAQRAAEELKRLKAASSPGKAEQP